MSFFKKHPAIIQVVIWLTIIGFVAAYIPLLFVSPETTKNVADYAENGKNSQQP